MFYVILLLIQLKFQILLLFLKFYDFCFKVLLSCALLSCTCLPIICHRLFICIYTVLLLFEFGVNKTLSVLFCIVALACQIAKVLLRDNLVVVLLDVLFRKIIGVFWHDLKIYWTDLRYGLEPRMITYLFNWNTVLWVNF